MAGQGQGQGRLIGNNLSQGRLIGNNLSKGRLFGNNLPLDKITCPRCQGLAKPDQGLDRLNDRLTCPEAG